MQRWFLISLLAIAGGPLRAAPPSFLFILIDDMGYGDLSCYGNTDIQTPNIDRLAREGTRFTQFYVASPICSPSRVGFTTGQFPARHRITGHFDSRKANRDRGMPDWLDPKAPAVARVFRDGGYATAHFGKWHMGGGRDVGDAPLPQAYGFEESLVSFEGLGDRVLPPGGLADQSAKLDHGQIRRVKQREQTGIYVDRAIDFLMRNRDRPHYLHLWLNEVHDGYDPRPELMEKHARFAKEKYVQQYYATIDSMDQHLGRLLQALDDLGIAKDTIVALASDNGPTAWPRYYREGRVPPGSTTGLRGRKWSLYEGGIREPFLVRWPGHVPGGKVNTHSVVAAVDLLPTFCALAKLQAPTADLDGENMADVLLGSDRSRTKTLFWDYGRSPLHLRPGLEHDRSPPLALRDGAWKCLAQPDGSQFELYDVAADPAESKNLADAQPDRAKEMKERLLDWFRGLQADR